MNEITRIHLAKTAYDVEIKAKKELEKYIKSLESYTQDAEVLTDIEIRITELLAERGVAAGGVISSDDVTAIRKQLGEPHEFAADGEGDIAVGSAKDVGTRRLYRSVDNAVLGGVLSGVAAYFNVNPLWTRLVFVLLMFISFGFAAFAYILAWIIVPPARTATEKLQLAGRDVTLESIKELNADEESTTPNRVAPVLQRILAVGLGIFSTILASITFIGTAGLVIAAVTQQDQLLEVTNGFQGLGHDNAWIVWLVFCIVILGLLLLTALFALIAYAFFGRKLTKRMLISAVIITVLGITSVAATIGISATQSWRVANETRSMVRDTKASLPKEFAQVKNVTFTVTKDKADKGQKNYIDAYALVNYIVDEGPVRYELTALPTAKPAVTVDGANATVTLTVPESYRNSFVQPVLTVYGPALDKAIANGSRIDYTGQSHNELTVTAKKNSTISVSGSYAKVTVNGSGSVDLSSSTVQSLSVDSEQNLSVNAGTVRELTVKQPDVCPGGTYGQSTNVFVAGVTSGEFTYNGKTQPAVSQRTSCAIVTIDSIEDEYTQY